MHPESFVFKRVVGCELRADVYRPDGEVVRPVLVWIHGGALIMGSRTRINPDHRDRYLAAGFAVVAIDYRLAPETLLPAIAEDIQDAFAWIRDEGARVARLDPERIAVVGHSAGGYLTLLSGCLIEPRPRALVTFYGYGDIAGDWYSQPDPFYCQEPLVAEADARAAVGDRPLADAPDLLGQTRRSFYLWCRQQGRWPHEVVGADPHTEPEAFEPWCPVRHVTTDYPPTLLLHGDKDTDVPYAQSVMMTEALAQARVEHEFITIPGGGHGFERDMADQPVVQRAFERVLAFLSRHLAGANDLVQRFADGADHLAAAVADFSDRALRTRPTADNWSPAEILAHLADAEILASERFRRIIADPDAQIEPLDQVNWAEHLRYTERDPAIALATFRALRAANAEILRLISTDAWARTGRHRTLGPTSLRDQVESFAHHTEEHIAQIAALRP